MDPKAYMNQGHTLKRGEWPKQDLIIQKRTTIIQDLIILISLDNTTRGELLSIRHGCWRTRFRNPELKSLNRPNEICFSLHVLPSLPRRTNSWVYKKFPDVHQLQNPYWSVQKKTRDRAYKIGTLLHPGTSCCRILSLSFILCLRLCQRIHSAHN